MIASMSKIIEKDIKVVEEIKQDGWWLAWSFSRLVVANAVVHLSYVSYLKNLSLNKDYWGTWVMLCEYEHIKWRRCSTMITTKSLTLRNMMSMDGHFGKINPFLKTSNSLKYATTTRGSKFERFNVVLGFGTWKKDEELFSLWKVALSETLLFRQE